MEIVNQATGEITDRITVADVDASIARVINHAESIWDEWAWQVENETWLLKGYSSWDEMRRSVYGGFTAIAAPRQDRPELVARFRRAGLTQKQTAETLGVGLNTVARAEPEDLQGQRGPSKTPQMGGFEENVVVAEIVDDDPPAKPEPEIWRVPDDAWSAPEPRAGVTDWSRRVQDITASLPIDDLTNDELAELLGAVEYLHNYIKGERALRQKGMN